MLKQFQLMYTKKVEFSLQITMIALKLFSKKLDCCVDFEANGISSRTYEVKF